MRCTSTRTVATTRRLASVTVCIPVRKLQTDFFLLQSAGTTSQPHKTVCQPAGTLYTYYVRVLHFESRSTAARNIALLQRGRHALGMRRHMCKETKPDPGRSFKQKNEGIFSYFIYRERGYNSFGHTVGAALELARAPRYRLVTTSKTPCIARQTGSSPSEELARHIQSARIFWELVIVLSPRHSSVQSYQLVPGRIVTQPVSTTACREVNIPFASSSTTPGFV